VPLIRPNLTRNGTFGNLSGLDLQAEREAQERLEMTGVRLKFTGDVRTRMGTDRMDFAFEGTTLGELLEALFARHELRDLILDEAGSIRPWSRVVVNGRFSYLVGDMDAPVQDGDMIVLMRPYVVAF